MIVLLKRSNIIDDDVTSLNKRKECGPLHFGSSRERASQQPMQQMRNAVSKGPPLTYTSD